MRTKERSSLLTESTEREGTSYTSDAALRAFTSFEATCAERLPLLAISNNTQKSLSQLPVQRETSRITDFLPFWYCAPKNARTLPGLSNGRRPTRCAPHKERSNRQPINVDNIFHFRPHSTVPAGFTTTHLA